MSTRIFHFKGFLFVLFCFCAIFRANASQSPEFTIEPVPDWASSIEVKDYDNPLENEADSGVFCLLFDVEINGGTQERFVHFANKFLTTSGVEANSSLSFDFDPSYQQLVLHKVVIHRGDQVIDELDPAKIRLIEQEKELDRQIYNGAKTAVLFLEDVRVGDWVEYAYTVRGRNPVEAGHFYDCLQLRWPFPIQTENYRLLWPQAKQPLVAQISKGVPRNWAAVGENYEYHWHWENRPGQPLDSFLAISTMPYAMAYFSDFRSWADIADWASTSFEPTNCSDELLEKVLAWRNEKVSNEQRVVEAVQFVQDDIRYLGIENGVSSREATDPSIVFARGYGDCKDKALLLCTILRLFDNVDATPVLVSTTLRSGIEVFNPNPLVFDHAIVRIVLDGETNYVDATRSFQRGPLDRRFIDLFGDGLPLTVDTPGLIKIPSTNNGLPETILDENFNVLASGAADLDVTNTLEGRDADSIRRNLATVSRDTAADSLLDYYKKYYSDISATEAPEIFDDNDADVIRIVAHYYIPKIWKPAQQTNFITCTFDSPGILSRLFIPAKRDRTMPLAVLFPVNFLHRIYIEPHEAWRVNSVDEKIQTRALLFHSKTYVTNDQVRVINQLLTLSDRVDLPDLPEYFADIDRISQLLGLAVTKPVPGTAGQGDSLNWSIWMAAIFFTIILLIVAVAIYRYQPASTPDLSPPPDPHLNGLGGWLIPLGLGLIVALPWRVYLLIKTSAAFSLQNWHAFTDPASATYKSMAAPVLLYELFTQLAAMVFLILLLVFFFQKRKIFPPFFIGFLLAQFVIVALDHVLAKSLQLNGTVVGGHASPVQSLPQLLFPVIIWGLYFRRSKRVKSTFRN